MARPYSRLESMQDGDPAFLIPSATPGRDPGRSQRCRDLGKDPGIARVAHGGPVLPPKDTSQRCSCRSQAQCTASLGAGGTYPRAGTQSSHFPGGSRDNNITPQWVLPHTLQKHFHFLPDPARWLCEAGQADSQMSKLRPR